MKMGDWSASLDVLGQFFYIIFMLAIVILLFLFCAKWLSSLRIMGRGKNIRVIESCGVAPQSSVQIVRAGERFFLIGVTKDHISFLTEITGEAINAPDKTNAGLFEQILKKYLPKAGTHGKEDGA